MSNRRKIRPDLASGDSMIITARGRGEDRVAVAMPRSVAEQGPEARDLFHLLAEHARIRVEIDEHIATHVRLARAAGLSWRSIGSALDMTDEGARKAYGDIA